MRKVTTVACTFLKQVLVDQRLCIFYVLLTISVFLQFFLFSLFSPCINIPPDFDGNWLWNEFVSIGRIKKKIFKGFSLLLRLVGVHLDMTCLFLDWILFYLAFFIFFFHLSCFSLFYFVFCSVLLLLLFRFWKRLVHIIIFCIQGFKIGF